MAAVPPASTGLGDMARETALSFGINWGDFLSQLVCFMLVVFLLQRFVFRPILKVLDERSRRIAESLANAERTAQELQNTQAAREAVLQMARQEAERILSETRTIATEIQEQARDQAEKLRNELLAQAQLEAKRQQELMRASLRDELADLIVEASMLVTNRVLADTDREKLLREAARNLAA
jgi:F-type H+-transporting ATPase subunit b